MHTHHRANPFIVHFSEKHEPCSMTSLDVPSRDIRLSTSPAHHSSNYFRSLCSHLQAPPLSEVAIANNKEAMEVINALRSLGQTAGSVWMPANVDATHVRNCLHVCRMYSY